MKVTIITEAGKKVGFGHLTRCISLYEAFDENNIDTELIIDGDDSCEIMLNEKKYKRFNWVDNKEMLFVEIMDSDIVVVDSYLAKEDFYRQLSKQVNLAVYIDDNKRINYPAGVVVNISIYAKELDYPRKKEIRYILGPRFALLRKEYWNIPQKTINNVVENILVTFGGNDSKNMTFKILNKLNTDFPQLLKYVIIGQAFTNIEELENIRDARTTFIYSPDAETMKKFMLKSDIAISAGGQTLYELARTATPTVAICVAENQRLALEAWDKKGFIEYLGWHEKAEEHVSEAIKNIAPTTERKKRGEIGKKFIDGQGARKLIKELLKFSKLDIENNPADEIFLESLKDGDVVDLFNWRNNPQVRKNFFNPDEITWHEHKKWFDSIIKDNSATIYMAFQEKKKIGTIRYEDKGSFISVSVMLNPIFMGQGLGAQIIKLGTEKLAREQKPSKLIVAEIKEDNIASIKAFTKAGYRKNDTVYIFNPGESVFSR